MGDCDGGPGGRDAVDNVGEATEPRLCEFKTQGIASPAWVFATLADCGPFDSFRAFGHSAGLAGGVGGGSTPHVTTEEPLLDEFNAH